MANQNPWSALRSLRTLFTEGKTTEQTDSQLLERFAAKRGESADAARAAEAAFATLVDRHGAMVWGVCRRVLHDIHDAEDAFQATFLILVKKASVVRVDGSLGRWLYGVAHRVALRARSEARRRDDSEPRRALLLPSPSPSVDPAAEAERGDLNEILNEEVDRLPAKFRGPIELCYLHGMTYEEAARQLDWPTATVKSRLTRARLRLRERLSRRGFASAEAGLAAAPLGQPRPAAPEALVHSTIRGANSMPAGAFPAAVTALSERVLAMMFLEKLRLVATGAVIVACLGIGALAQQASQDRIPERPQAAVPPPKEPNTKSAEDPRWVRNLPSGATIEVVGISSHPSGPDTWWGPDGKRLAVAPADRSGTRQTPGQDVVSRAIVVRATGLPPDADYRWFVSEARGGAQAEARLGGIAVPGLRKTIADFDRDLATCTVHFKLAAGAWKTAQTWGTGPGSRGDANGTSYIFGKPIETRLGTTLSVTHNLKDGAIRLVAVDRDGNEHPGQLRSGGGVWDFHQVVVEFDLAPQKIKQFWFQTRTFEEVEIPGIALWPREAE